jgi:hypothetical protein
MANSYGPKSMVQNGLVFLCDPANSLCYTSGSSTITNLYSEKLVGGPATGSFIGDCYWDKIEWVCDGTGDWVEVQPFSTPGSAYTISAWVKSNTSTWNQYGIVASKRDSFILHPTVGQTKMTFYCYTDAGTGTAQYTGATITEWHQWVGTYDGTQSKLYLNGELKNTVSLSGTAVPDASGVMLIGGDDGFNRSINGKMGTVKMYNRALTDAECLQDYNATKGRYS